MVRMIGSRLTYANVMATVAVFLALGGAAYAVSGIPDRSDIYHGCVDPKAGALRVVATASSCRKTKTVRRGKRRIRIPGESAIAWNQHGLRGVQGQTGDTGPPGQEATKLFASVDDNGATGTANVEYGSGVTGVVDPGGDSVYTVTFNRSLANCVVQAVPGVGDPQTPTATALLEGIPSIQMNESGNHNQVQVGFRSGSTPADTSFMITAFC